MAAKLGLKWPRRRHIPRIHRSTRVARTMASTNPREALINTGSVSPMACKSTFIRHLSSQCTPHRASPAGALPSTQTHLGGSTRIAGERRDWV